VIFRGLYEWIRDGFAMIFTQKSVSRQSFFRSFLLSFIWVLHGVLCGVLVNYIGLPGLFIYHGIVILFYICMWFGIVPRRQSILPYCAFMSIYRFIWCIYYIMAAGYVTQLYYPILSMIGLLELPLTFIW
jgi:hypothetical protein